MIKKSITGLLVLAALFIPSTVSADTPPTVTVVSDEQMPLVATLLPEMQPSLRYKRGEICPPVPQADDPWPAAEVSLVGGCQTSSLQQHSYALKQNLTFVTSAAEYQTLIAQGHFVRLKGPHLQVLAKRPYALPSTVSFMQEMSAAYQATGCGQVVVKDAVRLMSERPPNGSWYSVHPAGMAIDIRIRYIAPECADWLRMYVRQKEAAGAVDGTHELHPEHLHIVVPLQPRMPPETVVATSLSVGAP